MSAISFDISHRCSDSHARTGKVTTPHGVFDTPAFMPVGTQGTVKGVLPDQVRDTGAQIILGNTYHLHLRPGPDAIRTLGGLQQWTRWQGPMLTDSGGFQVFSLARINKMDEQGVRFRSHLDGREINLTPEVSMQTQVALGADIIMAFDDCPPAQQTPVHARAFAAANETRTKAVRKIQTDMDDGDYRQRVKAACERTLRWLDRCQAEFAQLGGLDNQALFPIVQGGTDLELRQWHVEQTIQRDAPGYAIGGVAVGETSAQIARVVEFTAPLLPQERPRYLMGVGYERDIVAAVRAGVDMFDCVLPTRNARNAQAFTPNGPIKLRNACHALDEMPVDETCDCACCGAGYSRAYLHHMFKANEMLGGILLTLHNLRHFQRLMLDIRATIRDNTWSEFYRQWPVALPLTV